MTPELSIIIPTYKRYDELTACIKSVLIQNGNYELIVISDGFDKKTDNIVRQIRLSYKHKSNKLIYLKQKNRGPASARNNGLHHVQSEIITFLDDDCVVCENWVDNILSAHKHHPDVLAIAGRLLAYDNGIISEFNQSLEAGTVTKNNTVFCPSLINNNSYKKSVFKIVGTFDQTFRYAAGEDVEFNYRLYSHNIKTLFVKNILIKHRYKTKLSQLLSQQFNFGKERLKIMRTTNDYPFDKSNKVVYILKRLATPFADPWLRLICAFKLKKKYKLLYLPLGYLQQIAYWSGFMCAVFRDIFKNNTQSYLQ